LESETAVDTGATGSIAEEDKTSADEDDASEVLASQPAGATSHWDAYAVQQCDDCVAFISWQTSEERLMQELRTTTAVQGAGSTLVIYDAKSAGESKTHPKFRTPPLRTATMQQHTRAMLKARFPSHEEGIFEMGEQDVYLFFDAKSHQHEKAFRDAFAHPENGPIARTFKTVFIMYDAESVDANLGRNVAGEMSKDLTDFLICCS
jgi:hypothetical protein